MTASLAPTRRVTARAPAVTLTGVSKRHGAGPAAVIALQDIALERGTG